LVSSALIGGWIAAVTFPRLTYFLTVPFLALSVVALGMFREPRLHKAEAPQSLRSHVNTTYRTILQGGCLVPIITLMVLTSLLLSMLFEFGALWLVALAAPAILYGPHFAGLTSALGIGGLLGGRVRLTNPPTLGLIVGLMALSSLTLTTSHSAVVVTGAQVLLAILIVTISIFLTAQLHDAIPSNIRSGVASGVGTFTWIAFLPLSLIFGYVSKQAGVYTAGWMITGIVVVMGFLLVRLVLDLRSRVAGGGEPTACPALATS
jgi:hypothetical protein